MNQTRFWLPAVLSFSGLFMELGDRTYPWLHALGMLGALMLGIGLLTLMIMVYKIEKEVKQMKEKVEGSSPCKSQQ